jgi:hypothetical protein
MEIDVFADGFLEIPLGLRGGVLSLAELDGKPARLTMVAPRGQKAAIGDRAQRADRAEGDSPIFAGAKIGTVPPTIGTVPAKIGTVPIPGQSPSLVLLHLSGKGRHTLRLEVRLKLARQGGWRGAFGVLPAAPATAVEIAVPDKRTDVRLGQVADRRSYRTEKPGETIRTTLGLGGAFAVQWRPEVAEGQVDRALTAVSHAIFDVQEDGLRLAWQLALEFPRAEREQFRVVLPAGYLLEKVQGDNVRGWNIEKTAQGDRLDISLLRPAKDREAFTLRLWRAAGKGDSPIFAGAKIGTVPAKIGTVPAKIGTVPAKIGAVFPLTRFDVPAIAVPEAVLHTGQLTIRRSGLLDLRTLESAGLSRTDVPPEVAAMPDESSPTGVRLFESYRFASVPFVLRLAAEPAAAQVSAAVETVLKIGDDQQSLESRVRFDVRGRPVYQFLMLLPDGFRLDQLDVAGLAPGGFQYAVTRRGGRGLLTIYTAAGRQGETPVVVRGQLAAGQLVRKAAADGPSHGLEARAASPERELPLPRLEVLGVARQEGEVAVEVDPDFDVEAANMTDCEPVLLGRLAGWLKPEQMRLAGLALHYSAAAYSGTLRLKRRAADVQCDTITNVRVTDRAVEETIRLDFTIERAGVRDVSFLLPKDMAGSRISVPMLRQKTVTPAGDRVRVRIELQDERIGQLIVAVTDDRLLTSGAHDAPIPAIETGRTGRRYVVIENAGHDEVVPEGLRDVEPLGPRQEAAEKLKAILGRELTMAYVVASDAAEPRLRFHTETHAAVATVKASIPLARTRLVLDANGAYRAEVSLAVNNATEQFLDVRLPPAATLWTVRVAGEPVKPTQVPGSSDPREVRIPLIKTAAGEGAYDVVLKYGGDMRPLKTVGSVDFPMIRCQNIQPELSQAWLYLPKEYRWFGFGGTMHPVAEEADLEAGYVQFQTKQIRQSVAALREGDKWTKARAAANLKAQVEVAAQAGDTTITITPQPNASLQSELAANKAAVEEAQQQVVATMDESKSMTANDENRQRLIQGYQGQVVTRSRNVVGEIPYNWNWSAQTNQIEGTTITINQAPFAGQPSAQPPAQQVMQFRSDERRLRGSQIFDGKRAPAGALNINIYNPQPQQGQAAGEAQDTDALQRYERRLNERNASAEATDNLKPLWTGGGGDYGGTMGRHDMGRAPAGEAGNEPLNNSGFGYPEAPNATTGGWVLNAPSAAASPASAAAPAERSMGTGSLGTPFIRSPETMRRPSPPAKPCCVEPAASVRGGRGGAAPQPPAAGLASLDFTLPIPGGEPLRFTTPRGSMEITAHNVSRDLLARFREMAIVVVVALAAWAVAGLLCRGRLAWLGWLSRSWLLVFLGALLLISGAVPLLGLAAIVLALTLKVHRWTTRSLRPATAK